MAKKKRSSKGKNAQRRCRPESLMMSYGYKPGLSEGAIKPPVFLTSTWEFPTADEGRKAFEIATGKRKPAKGEVPELIYSRLNHPDLQIAEERLTLWDKAQDCAIFSSGMSALATTLLAIVRPGDHVLYSEPLYGGTDKFVKKFLKDFGVSASAIESRDPHPWCDLAAIVLETPANPTNTLYDIEYWAKAARRIGKRTGRRVPVIVDNTFLGPLFQHPLKHGADLVLYSATKFIGGHSDLIAGAVLGSKEAIAPIKAMRALLGTMADPFTVWQILRSLETLKMRMTAQAKNAVYVAKVLGEHKAVQKVYYLGNLDQNSPQRKIFGKQCLSAGSMISFEIKGGRKAAYKFLNSLKLVKLAVSLGSTESLAQHPATMTHAGVDDREKAAHGISENLVRLSVGIEDHEDLVADIEQALNKASK